MWTIQKIMDDGVLSKLDSLTKYPSILTYHMIGKRGGSFDSLVEGKGFEDEQEYEITEKVDGTNFRLIALKDDFLIGKRETLVYAKGDRIMTEHLCQTVLDKCSEFIKTLEYGLDSVSPNLIVIFGEVYGHNVQRGSKQYCGDDKETNFRCFDVARFSQEDLDEVFSYDLQRISAWREAGMNKFISTKDLDKFCAGYNIARTPVWKTVKGSEIPKSASDTLDWMEQFVSSKSTISESGENINPLYGRAEGVVIRNPNRSFIRKLRFEDYRKGKLKNFAES